MLRVLCLTLFFIAFGSTTRVCNKALKNKKVSVETSKSESSSASLCMIQCREDPDCVYYNFNQPDCSLSKIKTRNQRRSNAGSCTGPSSNSDVRACQGPFHSTKYGIKTTKVQASSASSCKKECQRDSNCLLYNYQRKKCSLGLLSRGADDNVMSGACSYEDNSSAPPLDNVVFPLMTVPHIENPLGLESGLADMFPKYTTVFGIPVFGGSKITVTHQMKSSKSTYLRKLTVFLE